jgi:hypothetical protein
LWAALITNFLAVLISSTGSRIYEIFKHPINILWEKAWGGSPPASPGGERDPQEVVIMSIKTLYTKAKQRIRRVEESDEEDYLLLSSNTPTAPNGPKGLMGFLLLALIIVVVWCPLAALLVSSIESAGIATGKLAISTDPNCGEYEFRFDSRLSLEPFLEYERQAESQAAEYAQKCYGPTSIATDCNKFYSQNITYTKNDSASCPFDDDVCEGGKNGALRITTGLLPGSLLGINAANPYFFGRSTTCAPMITGKNYVRVGVSARNEEQWEYWYGRAQADYTWANPVAKSSWAIKGYSMEYVNSTSSGYL